MLRLTARRETHCKCELPGPSALCECQYCDLFRVSINQSKWTDPSIKDKLDGFDTKSVIILKKRKLVDVGLFDQPSRAVEHPDQAITKITSELRNDESEVKDGYCQWLSMLVLAFGAAVGRHGLASAALGGECVLSRAAIAEACMRLPVARDLPLYVGRSSVPERVAGTGLVVSH